MTQETKRENAQNEKVGYMSQLEEWIDREVIEPLYLGFTDGDKDIALVTVENVTKALKAKILESYRNGQKTPTAKEGYQGQNNRSNRRPFHKTFGRKGDRGDVRKA